MSPSPQVASSLAVAVVVAPHSGVHHADPSVVVVEAHQEVVVSLVVAAVAAVVTEVVDGVNE
jgi:hypothetical protein